MSLASFFDFAFVVFVSRAIYEIGFVINCSSSNSKMILWADLAQRFCITIIKVLLYVLYFSQAHLEVSEFELFFLITAVLGITFYLQLGYQLRKQRYLRPTLKSIVCGKMGVDILTLENIELTTQLWQIFRSQVSFVNRNTFHWSKITIT